ncbi:hypothetical protein JCM19231_4050 [Vibrio ishigakensis]|uniref:DUF2909 domain-containing protein n=1 Tax=Vibrio ishigakensis TaxID=1481914 RepID=A0A0B8NZD8_9VIBR|nr:hypothetical protein JCM19231_4050 [Vibrio ishigakensis]
MSPFIFKLIIIGLLLFILVNLAKALFIMVKEDGSKPMTRYLGRRVLLSASVILFLILALKLGG